MIFHVMKTKQSTKLIQAHGALVVAEALQDGAPGGQQPAAQAAGHARVQVRTTTTITTYQLMEHYLTYFRNCMYSQYQNHTRI